MVTKKLDNFFEKNNLWDQVWKTSIVKGLELIQDEYLKSAMEQHTPSFHSYHEGYAVIKEELEEFWDHVKKHKKPSYTDLADRMGECVQIGAMALALIIHCEVDMTIDQDE